MCNPERKRLLWPVLALLLLGLTLACGGFGGNSPWMYGYGIDSVPPFWLCASITPAPTRTPESAPATPFGTTATPGGWGPPDWPPTAVPTPTEYPMFGSFYQHQRIWIPVRNDAPPPGENTPTPRPGLNRDVISIQVDYPQNTDVPGCMSLGFDIRNHSDQPVDFDFWHQMYLRVRGSTTLYPASEAAEDDPYAGSRLDAGQRKLPRLTFCGPPGIFDANRYVDPANPDVVLVVLTSAYGGRVGTQGGDANALEGADTAIFVNFWALAPECSYPPPTPAWPELGDCTCAEGSDCCGPPPLLDPQKLPFLVAQMGGRLSGDAPLSIPPCARITRGFGCDDYPTGMDGGPRCPLDKPYWHFGIDISCAEGIPIYNVLDGVITWWGPNRGYGNLASVTNGPITSMYAHLSAYGSDPLCSGLGGMCVADRVIGAVGNTGFSTGPHLHWEVRLNGVPVDPALYFGGGRTGTAREAALAPLRSLTATLPAPQPFPLTVLLRDPGGAMLSGPTLHLSDIDGNAVGACAFEGGRCEFALPPGPYAFRLEGSLADGTPVDAYGQANVAAQERAEYLMGPLSVWHEAPATTVGLVLVRDASGVAQPLQDGNPQGPPRPRNPLDLLPSPEPAAPAYATPAPAAPVDEGGRGAYLLLGLLCAGGALALVAGAYLGRRWRQRAAGGRRKKQES